MFIGHFAVGLASKRWAPRTSLGYLLLAPLLLDLLWPIFVLLGIEQFRIAPSGNPFLNLAFEHYPWSHSLLLAVLLALLLAWFARRRGGERTAPLVLGIGVVSHWVLDWVTHQPDLPLWPGGPLVGLGLWHSPPATIVTESLMLAIGAGLYLTTTRPKDKIGSLGILAYLALLAALYVQSIVASLPPPGSERLIVVAGLLAGGLLVVLAGWIDRHRIGRSP